MSDLAGITLPDNFDPNQPVQWLDEGDKGAHVVFYRHPVDGQEHVRIEFPGDTKSIPDYLATEYYQRRFARQWRVYKGETRRVRRADSH